MPTKLPRPCLEPGCSVLCHTPRCAVHGALYVKRRDAEDAKRRGTSSQRGYGAHHRKWRTMVLARCPLCVDCGQPATVADHITPLKQGGGWSLRNGAGRCGTCHRRKTARDNLKTNTAQYQAVMATASKSVSDLRCELENRKGR